MIIARLFLTEHFSTVIAAVRYTLVFIFVYFIRCAAVVSLLTFFTKISETSGMKLSVSGETIGSAELLFTFFTEKLFVNFAFHNLRKFRYKV